MNLHFMQPCTALPLNLTSYAGAMHHTPSLQLHIHKFSVLLPVSLLSTHLPVSLPRHVPPGGMPLMLAQLTYNLDLAVATMDL